MRIKTYTREQCTLVPYFVTVGIVTKGNTRHIFIESKIHVQKLRMLPHSYSTEFSDGKILNCNYLQKYLKSYS